MITLKLLLGIASIFAGGVIGGLAFRSRETRDFIGAFLGLVWGTYIVLTV